MDVHTGKSFPAPAARAARAVPSAGTVSWQAAVVKKGMQPAKPVN